MSFLRLHLLLNFSFCGRSLFSRSALVLGMTRDITCDSRHVQGASWTGSVWLSVQIGGTLYVCRYGLTYPMDVYKLIYIFSKYSKGKNFLPLQYLRLSQVSTPADKKCVFFLMCLLNKINLANRSFKLSYYFYCLFRRKYQLVGLLSL